MKGVRRENWLINRDLVGYKVAEVGLDSEGFPFISLVNGTKTKSRIIYITSGEDRREDSPGGVIVTYGPTMLNKKEKRNG